MDQLYNTYCNTVCKDIPIEYMKNFILDFLYDSSKDMGLTFDKEFTPGRVYDMIIAHYCHLPLFLIASAFKRGALGQYGAGRLVPRTIFGWLGEINLYYMTIHDKRDQSQDNKNKFDGLERYPLGKAICVKIDWLKSGAITEDEWDTIPLKSIAEMIGRGEIPTLEKFGI